MIVAGLTDRVVPATVEAQHACAPRVPAEAILHFALKGEVGEGKAICLTAIRSRLAAESFTAIHFEINSKGGDSGESFAIYNFLRALPVPIAATATGEGCSGALIIFMAAALRKAKAATFLIHPTSRARDDLPERVTAQILRSHADGLAKIDRRVVDLFTARTGYAREFFESEKATEDEMSDADAIQTGVVHEFEGLTPTCDPAWPDTARRVMKKARNVYLPSYMTSQNYFDACRCAAFFPRAGVSGGVGQ